MRIDGSVASPFASSFASQRVHSAGARQWAAMPGPAAGRPDEVSISAAARAAAAQSAAATDAAEGAGGSDGVAARLAEIKSRGAVNRSAEDTEYLLSHDKKLAEIAAKGDASRTAEEVDDLQKAGGFVNTMAFLSPAEWALYDKAVASGNAQAAEGLAQIALTRAGGQMAGGASGTTYDARATPITAENVAKSFSHSIVDASGRAASNFQALMRFLQADGGGA